MCVNQCWFTNHTNRYFQLKFAQQKFQQNECILKERLKSLEVQLDHMEAICQTHNLPPNNQIAKIKDQHATINSFFLQLQEITAMKLLKTQQMREEQAQKRDITRQYEQRIFEMNCTVYTKEVDISVDHVGKLNEEKPTISHIRQLSSFKIQASNVKNFMIRKSELLNGIKLLENRITAGKRERREMPHSSNKISHAKTENNLQDHFQKKTESAITKESSSSQSNPQISEVREKKRKKMLIISSQSKIYGESMCQADPQLRKMGYLLRIQKAKEEKLIKQYERLRNRFGQLCMENRDLSIEYKQMIGKNKLRKCIQEISICGNNI